MMMEEYAKARKLAQKAYRTALLKGSYPYLQVLDEILSFTKTSSEVDLGLVEIPLEQIAGTKTSGRTTAFSNNFMPLLSEDTEFAAKWSSLYHAHLEEGIRDPIKACEFMNRFYVIEGNKRVSVLKYSGAVSITGHVTRILPAKNDSKEVRIYYEFLDFYKLTAINYLWFSQEGSFPKLLKLLGSQPDHVWTDDEKLDFHSAYIHFTDVFEEKGGRKLMLTPGDAFLIYLEVYGYKNLWDKSHSQIRSEMSKLWKDFQLYPGKLPLELSMQPGAMTGKPVISRLIPLAPVPLKIAFIHDKTMETSSWTYGHELGRQHLNQVFGEQIETLCYDNINTEELGLKAIEEAVSQGSKVIFTTTPKLLGASIKAAIHYPDVKLLNCSLHTYSGHLRTYYGRLYEAKFLTGALAGILTDTPQVGYLADYPIYGATANINAFALGVKMTNPEAKVHLEWATVKGQNPDENFRSRGISYVSGQDLITPSHASRKFGLYDIREGTMVNVASSIWHWGKFYERIVRDILNGAWKKKEVQSKAVHYWWGISSGMIDVICSKSLPAGSLWLLELIKREMASFGYNPFSGTLTAQDGTVKSQPGNSLSPEEIITMDWLLDNVEGEIPPMDDLVEEAKPMIMIQGIRPPVQ
ncbi:MAG: BMP family ABC transporter substrate-binding protein [Lachnospiraceae bacterium]|nr:BMP family ABC transporter substrate-binding protein [Lachnospiraceae bacterium]